MLGAMYRPPVFDVAEPARLLSELLAQTAATLVTQGADALESTILPLLHDPTADGAQGPGGRGGTAPATLGTLSGHVSRPNPIVRGGDRDDALVVVTGPAGYISPSWYPSKADDGRVVPTWDYLTVQVNGTLRLHDDPGWLLAHLHRLTDRHERGRPTPWSVSDAPEDFVANRLRGIVGVEVTITRLVGKAKLSQNRSEEDVSGVITGLGATGSDADRALADAVAGAARPR